MSSLRDSRISDEALAICEDLRETRLMIKNLCATIFACQRLPQGMPVSPEDAQCLARETQQFLSTLFTEIETDGHQEENRQEVSGRPQKARPSRRQ